MNRITATFQKLAAAHKKALVGYLTAGDPNPETSFDILRAAVTSGLDILELGVPFSDPTADGPVIQEASQRALRAGMTLTKTLEMAVRLRAESDIPIMLFGYYNPLFKYGLDRIAKAAHAAGVDGLLVVDLPPEEAGPLKTALQGTDIQIVFLVAPTTRPDRVKKIAAETGGFLYLVTKAGTTGEGGLDYEAIRQHAAEVKAVSPLPVCLGFGIRNGDDAAKLAPMADGIIVGSTLCNVVGQAPWAPDLPERMAAKIQDLRAGLDRS
ncbi:MAG: tryptophan synthase subunit alpha [Kiritimatiellae bacterium]|jgi:tryptophan synthase alpha chain|nr:tryptophan synthase subunit alpha [Kiritimatiellia bacterium]NLD89025.1 tryptophan synthase subunit alpha [Lentisphaerota bacterium]